MKFLIQDTSGFGNTDHDFSFTLKQSCKFYNWKENNSDMFYYVCGFDGMLNQPDMIPVGSNEFVVKYLQHFYGLTPKPKNIPLEFLDHKWTGRTVINGTEKDIIGEKFVKSTELIKGFTEICSSAPAGNYQISDVVDILSEWRAFVYDHKLVGLKNYSGDFEIFPDVNKIRAMINKYTNQPIAYTLDVAVLTNYETVIIEVHDFYSCGLYGFAEHKILPFMFSRWFYSFVNPKADRNIYSIIN